MGKEIIISIIIIIGIFIGNIVTQNYTSKSINLIGETLEELRTELAKDELEKEKTENTIKKIDHQWEEMHNKMAYYIEHDELEKVETNLIALKSFCESEEYADAISELDKSVFVLQHIENKNSFNWQNIF